MNTKLIVIYINRRSDIQFQNNLKETVSIFINAKYLQINVIVVNIFSEEYVL